MLNVLVTVEIALVSLQTVGVSPSTVVQQNAIVRNNAHARLETVPANL
jgi:hypothetical protein